MLEVDGKRYYSPDEALPNGEHLRLLMSPKILYKWAKDNGIEDNPIVSGSCDYNGIYPIIEDYNKIKVIVV